MYAQLEEAANFIRNRTGFVPEEGLVLGTGLSGMSEEIKAEFAIPYGEIPHFPVSTVQSHKGQLILGYLSGKPVAALAGRFHYYEGYSMQQVTFPLRVLALMGIQRVWLSNAAGGVNPDFEAGDVVMIQDHINLMPDNPLRGPNDERLGPRFPDMLDAYSPRLLKRAQAAAAQEGMKLKTGVYAALPGPNLETPAEYTMLYRMGADLVGMSTVPEVLAARHMGLEVAAFSIVSNVSYPPERILPTSVEDVIRTVQAAEPRLRKLLLHLFENS